MQTRLSYPNAQDKHYLVDVVEFMSLIDSEDLACRDAKDVEDSFHVHWFKESKESTLEFTPPTIYFSEAGTIKFINGRHRTLVLSRHLESMPVAIASLDDPLMPEKNMEECRRYIRKMALRELVQGDIIEFPDLPIKYLGFDHNTGK